MKGPNDPSTDAALAWVLGMRKATPLELQIEESLRREARAKAQQSSSPVSGDEKAVPARADAGRGDYPPPAAPPACAGHQPPAAKPRRS